MKKNLKSTFLIVLSMLFLTGCGKWDEDKKAYESILKKGVECVYLPSEKYKKDEFGIQTIKFSANENGLFIQFNSDSPSEIYGPNGYKKEHRFNGFKFRITDEYTKEFLNYYLNNNKCPEKTFINGTDKRFLHKLFNEAYALEYELGTSTVKTQSTGEEKTCHHSSTDDCKKVKKELTQCTEKGKTIYIEYGYFNNYKNKYIGISSNDNYTDIVIDETESNGFSVPFGKKDAKYTIRQKDINDIWKSGNQLASADEISVGCDEYNNLEYFISVNNNLNDDAGITIDNGNQQEAKNNDTPYMYGQSIVIDHTIPTHNCTSLLGDPNDKSTPSPAFLLSYAFKVIRYIAIILLVVLSIMDFVSSVSSQDADSLKKAINKTIRRIILCVIIFLLPYLIEYVLSFLNDNATKICIST